MKTILLSFNPKYYEPLKSGQKKFEYRSRFSNEELKAYLYLSSPVRKIVAIIHFGKKIMLKTMLEDFSTDADVCSRIKEYIYRYNKKYAVPILRIEFLEPLSLDDIRIKVPGFMPPQSYKIIEDGTELQKLLSKINLTGKCIVMDHDNIEPNDICVN